MIEFPEFPPLPEAPETGYKTVMADPPWLNTDAGRTGAAAERYYDLLHSSAIAGLAPQVREATHSHAHLYLWAASPFVHDAFHVMEEWGFTYKAYIVWVKTFNDPEQGELPHEWDEPQPVDPYIGMGDYYRWQTEVLLFGVKNNLSTDGNTARNTIFAPTGEHSEKPDAAYRLAEDKSPGPRLDMFSRRGRDGWDSWGKEAP